MPGVEDTLSKFKESTLGDHFYHPGPCAHGPKFKYWITEVKRAKGSRKNDLCVVLNVIKLFCRGDLS